MVMNKIIFFLKLLIFVSLSISSPLEIEKNPIVETKYGKIMGNILETRLKNKFYGFRGIPYAKPPIGDLRFQAPQPPESWNSVLNATKDGPICPQLNTSVSITINESCLYINVYTKPDFLFNSILKPVLIFIHDGGFFIGSGSSVHYAGPQYIMDRDLVFVSFNYRLGALGFLALNNSKVPGNAGMKDQVMALKWVQENIEQFGGNKNLVTVMGSSAGGMSIGMHLVSPMSVGLFHRAILLSGTFTPHMEVLTQNIELARRQAIYLGCTEVDQVEDICNCLVKVSALNMPSTQSSFYEFSITPVLLFLPVVEPDYGQERFLIEKPNKSFKNGKIQKVPMIISITEDEFAFNVVIENKHDLHILDTEFNRVAPISLLYERNTTKSFEISEALWMSYNLSHPLNKSSLPQLSRLFADSLIGFGVHRFVNLLHKFTDVFYCKFSYQGRYSNFYYPENKPYGVSHMDDILYVLVREEAPMFQENDPEIQKVEQMTRLFSHFALSGIPVQNDDNFIGNVKWSPFTNQNHFYLDIGDELVLKENLREDRFAVWDKLFPIENDANE